MSSNKESLWLGLSETRLFQHDGLDVATEIGFVPTISMVSSPDIPSQETTRQRATRLLSPTLNGISDSIENVIEFRRLVLKEIYRAHVGSTLDSLKLKSSRPQSPKDAPAKPGAIGFSGRMSLAMLVPLLESQCKSDPTLCNVTLDVLAELLKTWTEFALKNEPLSFLDGLQSLLSSWLGLIRQSQLPGISAESVANSLVSLSCTRGHWKSFLQTIDDLINNPSLGSLQVGPSMSQLSSHANELQPAWLISRLSTWYFDRSSNMPSSSTNLVGDPASILYLHPKHQHTLRLNSKLQGWNCDGSCGYRSGRNPELLRYRCTEGCDYDLCENCMATVINKLHTSVASDGAYLYIAGRQGEGLSKVGTGFQGTYRGFPPETCPGNFLGTVLDTSTLKPIQDVLISPIENFKETIAFTSDSSNVVLVYVLSTKNSEGSHPVYANFYTICSQMNPLEIAIQLPSEGPLDISFIRERTMALGSDHPECSFEVTKVLEQHAIFNQLQPGDLIESMNGVSFTSKSIEAVPTLLGSSVVCQIRRKSATATLVRSILLTAPSSKADEVDAISEAARRPPGIGGYAELKAQALFGLKASSTSTAPASALTTCGIPLNSLKSISLYSCGQAVTIIHRNTGTTPQLLPYTPTTFGYQPSYASGSRSGTFNEQLSFSSETGSLRWCSRLQDFPDGSIHHASSPSELAVCIDVANDCLWSVGENWVDHWSNYGLPFVFTREFQTRIPCTVEQATDSKVPVPEVIAALLKFVMLEALNPRLPNPPNAPTSVDRKVLDILFNLLKWGSEQKHNPTIFSCLLVMRIILKSAAVTDQLEQSTITHLKDLIFSHLRSSSEAIQSESSSTLVATFSIIYPTSSDQKEFVLKLLSESAADSLNLSLQVIDRLRVLILDELRSPAIIANQRKLAILSQPDDFMAVVSRIFDRSIQDASARFSNQISGNVASIDTVFLASLQTFLFSHWTSESQDLERSSRRFRKQGRETREDYLAVERAAVLKAQLDHLASRPGVEPARLQALQEKVKIIQGQASRGTGDESESEPDSDVFTLSSIRDRLRPLIERYLVLSTSSCERILKSLLAMYPVTDSQTPAELVSNPTLQLQLETAMKNCLFGHLVPSLCTVKLDISSFSREFSSVFLVSMTSLLGITDQAAVLLRKGGEDVSQLSIESVTIQEEKVESIHPIHDKYKFHQDVKMEGCKFFQLSFDQRCSTQYDYDKVVVTATSASGSKKAIAEYGGNTHGFGSRNVLNGGWPKDPVRMSGDGISIDFEMRSGRESSTPDIAMWGFAIRVQGQSSLQSNFGNVSFAFEMVLNLTSTVACLHSDMFHGAPALQIEKIYGPVIGLDVIRDCSWPPVRNISSSMKPEALHFTVEARKNLHKLAAQPPLTYRASVEAALHPAQLEDAILGAAFKHLELDIDASSSSPDVSVSNDTSLKTLQVVFRKIRALERHLQALALLEEQWDEAKSIEHGSDNSDPVFFHDWHLNETHFLDLTHLCELLGIEPSSDRQVNVQELTKLLLKEASEIKKVESSTEPNPARFTRVSSMSERIRDRAILLYLANVGESHGLERSLSIISNASVESSNVSSSKLTRAPSVLETLGSDLLDNVQPTARSTMNIHDLQCKLVDSLFLFLNIPVSLIDSASNFGVEFLECANVRANRMEARIASLISASNILRFETGVPSAKYARRLLIELFSKILLSGPLELSVAGGGRLNVLRDQFGNCMKSMLATLLQCPEDYHQGLALCIIPFTLTEVSCLTNSGLVDVLSKLLVSATDKSIADKAWCGFQSLAIRCVDWDESLPTGQRPQEMDVLLCQISSLLSTHLERAVDSGASVDTNNSSEDLQTIDLLNDLAGSRFGKDIIAQPKCLAILLRILQHEATTPSLLRITIRLLALGLPVLSSESGSELRDLLGADSADSLVSAEARVLSVILHKLTTLIVASQNEQKQQETQTPKRQAKLNSPAALVTSSQATASPKTPVGSTGKSAESDQFSTPPSRVVFLPFGLKASDSTQNFHPHDLVLKEAPYVRSDAWQCNECHLVGSGFVYHCDPCQYDLCMQCHTKSFVDAKPVKKSMVNQNLSGQFVVRLHRHEAQQARDIIQPIMKLTRRPFSFGSVGDQGSDPMANVMKVDRELNESNSAIAFRGDYKSCIQRSFEWTRLGIICSVDRDPEQDAAISSSSAKIKSEDTACKEANKAMAEGQYSKRPFLSGSLAASLANEFIGLVHSLLKTNNDLSNWVQATELVFANAIEQVPRLTSLLACEGDMPSEADFLVAHRILAVFCILGGFREEIHPGSEVIVIGDSLKATIGKVVSFNPDQGEAKVVFANDAQPQSVHVTMIQSISELPPKRVTRMINPLVTKAFEALLAQGAQLPLGSQSSATEAASGVMATGLRLLAELRSRSCMVMSVRLRTPEAADEFIRNSPNACQTVIRLAKEARTVSGVPAFVAESICSRLRRSFFERNRPKIEVPPPKKKVIQQVGPACWSISHISMIHRCITFANNFTCLTTLPCSTKGLIDLKSYGEVVYADAPVPSGCATFHCELLISALGTDEPGSSESGGALSHFLSALSPGGMLNHPPTANAISFGLAQTKSLSRPDEQWSWPPNSILLTSMNPMVNSPCSILANGSTTLSNPTTRLKVDDVIGFTVNRGKSFSTIVFYVNGVSVMKPVNIPGDATLFPVFYTQLSGIEVSVNFGAQPFHYPPSKPSAEVESKTTAEESEADVSALEGLPFADVYDVLETPVLKDMSIDISFTKSPSPQKQSTPVIPKVPTKSCWEQKLSVQPRVNLIELPGTCNAMYGSTAVAVGEEEEEEEDMTTKLIKAWEAQVFPKIKSRFRNNSERQSGYEQIKGALQFGMPDVAQMTIAMLFEESGGIPADLHLPTIEDLKANANTLGANQIKKGMRVQIQYTPGRSEYEVPGMELTRNKVGIVVAVESKKSIAQVDVYLDDEACLVGYWYPISILQKALQYSIEIEATSSGSEEHKELLLWESRLTRLYSAAIALQLFDHDLLNVSPLSSVLSTSDALRLLAFQQQRVSIPGDCFARQPSAAVFFNWTPKSRKVWFQHLSRSYSRAVESGTAEEFEKDICACLIPPKCTTCFPFVEMVVESGRKQFNVEFDDCCGIILSLQAKDSGSRRVIAKPASVKDGPWARVYSGKDANGAQFATFPSTNPGSDPLPSVIITSRKIHVRTTGQDSSPNAIILAHGIPSDFPLAIAFIQHVVSTSPSVSISSLCMFGKALCTLLEKAYLAPLLREVLLHTLALILRRLGDQATDSESIFVSTETLQSELAPVKEFANSTSHVFTKFPTYFQALFELAIAHWDVVGEAVDSEPEVHEEKKHTPPKHAKSSPGRGAHKRRVQGSSSRKKTKYDPIPEPPKIVKPIDLWLLNSKRLFVYLRLLLSRSDADFVDADQSDDMASLPRSLLKIAWLTCNTSEVYSRLVIIRGIPTTLSATDVRSALTFCANLSGGLYQQEMYIPVNENGVVSGDAIVELRSCRSVDTFKAAIVNRKEFTTPSAQSKISVSGFDRKLIIPAETQSSESSVSPSLKVASKQASSTPVPASKTSDVPAPPPLPKSSTAIALDVLIDQYVTQKLIQNDQLNPRIVAVLTAIIKVTYSDVILTTDEAKDKPIVQLADVLSAAPFDSANIHEDVTSFSLLRKFFHVFGLTSGAALKETFSQYSSTSSAISLNGLATFTLAMSATTPRLVLRAFDALGVDHHFEMVRPFSFEAAVESMSLSKWTHVQDLCLVSHVNSIVRALHVPSKHLRSIDYYISEAELAQEGFIPLHEISISLLRLRFAILSEINSLFVPAVPCVDLRNDHLPMSLANTITMARGYIFYDLKEEVFDGVLNETCQRTEPTGPEISLNPLETVGTCATTLASTQFVQAMHQIELIDPALLRVKLASGGDPIFPLNVRLSGESVQGTSGSFREFVLRMVHEILSPTVGLVQECPSAALGKYKGRYILKSGHLTYSHAKMYEFLGVLIGICLRADVPMALDMMPIFWKSLVGDSITLKDLQQVDLGTHRHLEEVLTLEDEDFAGLQFSYHTLDGTPIDLKELGHVQASSSDARQAYIHAIQKLRLKEMTNGARIQAVRNGLSKILPIEMLSIMSWQDLEFRVCGLPDVDLLFLKAHTMCQVGLSESDAHVGYFWKTLESFSKEQLRMFIKFACNQERVPATCPCQGGAQKAHVPPYPMKIAPPDGQGPPDGRFIRAETCLFMIKLPQYSSQELMSQRLTYAIHCREDPLSG